MRLIIDIQEDWEKQIELSNDAFARDFLCHVLRNGIPISDNATNGEVLKIMFMPNRITRTNDIVHVEYDFTPDWWNALYERN